MEVGNTVREIFGSLPDEATLCTQTGEVPVCQTNLHIHLPPNFGSIKSLDDAIANARKEQIAVLGACNYYDYSVYTPFAHAAVQSGIAPVFGTEVLTMNAELQVKGILVNDPKNPGKIYICGKGLTNFDRIPESCRAIWMRIREGDKQRIEAMIAKLNAIDLLKQQGIQLRYAEIAQKIAEEKQVPQETVFLQERHLVQALQQAIFEHVGPEKRTALLQRLFQIETSVEIGNVVTIQDDLRNALLKQGRVAYVEECFVTPAEAADFIVGLGGYVSYPTLIDGAPQILAGEGAPAELTATLLEHQIGAAEFIPTRNDPIVLSRYVNTLRKHGIVVGAGTEHNAATWIPLQVTCRKGAPIGAELTRIFWEGACVAVAHQYRRAKGKAGYQFLPEISARDAQIREMAGLGSQIITFLRKTT